MTTIFIATIFLFFGHYLGLTASAALQVLLLLIFLDLCTFYAGYKLAKTLSSD